MARPQWAPGARPAASLGATLLLTLSATMPVTATDADPSASLEPPNTPEPATMAEPAAPLVLTPSQGEGPYYPLQLPADRDTDLTVVKGAEAPAVGEALRLEGLLLTIDGTPVEGATVEIWQTDANGVYLHPGDPDFALRDPGFQGYGEAVTDAEGAWAFRTILPEVYGSRPRHIHAKVRLGDETVLTTQVYFSGGDIPEAGAVVPTGTELDALMVEANLEPGPDGVAVLTAHHRIVIR
jgi:protocatechuate 3,4-dioxygenase beta subunit